MKHVVIKISTNEVLESYDTVEEAFAFITGYNMAGGSNDALLKELLEDLK